MNDCFTYTPGSLVTFYFVIKDGYHQRTDDGYIPVVTRIIIPGFTLAAGYPQNMTRLDVGLYYFQFLLPSGAGSVGTYFVDIAYLDPDSGLIANDNRQIVVIAPFGNFGLTPGGPGGLGGYGPPLSSGNFPSFPFDHGHHEHGEHDPCVPNCPPRPIPGPFPQDRVPPGFPPYPHGPYPQESFPRTFQTHRPFRGGR